MRKFPKKPHHEDEGWLLTYADFITLLFGFFFILFAMSEPKQEEMVKMRDALKEFVGKPSGKSPIDQMWDDFSVTIEQKSWANDVSVERTNHGLVLELVSSSFYQPGSAEFSTRAMPILEAIAKKLKDYDAEDYAIEVDGHTDDVPVKSAQFASNWELSALRATHVVRYFIESGMPPRQFHAAAFADTEPKVPNLDEQKNPIPENRELNRRVVIKLERKD